MSGQLQSSMRPFIDEIIKIIKDHLQLRGKKNAPDARPIFQCLAMVTTSVGPMLTRVMHEVLDLMFPWGLSDALYNALQVISRHIPPLLRTIQERLLDTLSLTLTGQPFKPLGAPAIRGVTNGPTRDYNLLQASTGGQPPETLALALKVLGSFDFSGTSAFILVGAVADDQVTL